MAEPPYSRWFDQVVPGVMLGIRQHNARSKQKISGKAVFLIIHTWCEQSPGSGLPSSHGNRMFNVQAELLWDSNNKSKGMRPGQERPGVHIKGVAQGEGATDDTRVIKVSPTFTYDSPERSVSHYLDVASERYKESFKTLTKGSGSFHQYAHNLKREGFATHAAYAKGLIALKYQVLRHLKRWVEYRLSALMGDVEGLTQDIARLRRKKDWMRVQLEIAEQLAGIGSISKYDVQRRHGRIDAAIRSHQRRKNWRSQDAAMLASLLRELKGFT